MEEWLVACKKADFKAIGEKFSIDQVIARIIRNRDVIEPDDIRRFLSGGIEDLYDPLLLKDADILTDILLEKMKKQQSIRIIGDYDIDGVMSVYILQKALSDCGARVSYQIPDRIKDGYGLSRGLVEEAKRDGIDTILTCDNGIAALEEISYAKSMGMTVLVTDHHAPPYEEKDGIRRYLQSEADAIVNPHQIDCPYPYKELCGAGVAWKIICLLFRKSGRDMAETEQFLENVAFATVGDIVDLTGENRILVKEGIKRIHLTTNIGMEALIAQCGLEPEEIDAFHFGFVLGPCINASGRLETARKALELFFAQTKKEAVGIANELVVLNEQRKEMTKQAVKKACSICEEAEYKMQRVLVVFLPDVHESIAGIVAGRLRDYFYKPVFVLTRGEDGIKGSGRSIEGYSMYNEMCKCRELFIKFGGHPMAAGLSMQEDKISLLRKKLNMLTTLSDEDLVPKVHIDVPMPVDYVTEELVSEFALLAPFGKGNPKPVFADKDLFVCRMWLVGRNQNVLRMSMRTAAGTPVDAVYFGEADSLFSYLEEKFGKMQVEAAKQGRENQVRISIVYFPRIHTYNGRNTLQFEIAHYR